MITFCLLYYSVLPTIIALFFHLIFYIPRAIHSQILYRTTINMLTSLVNIASFPFSLSLWVDVFFRTLISTLVTFQGEAMNTLVQSTIFNKEPGIDFDTCVQY